MPRLRSLALIGVVASASLISTARAEIDVELTNGARVNAALADGTDVHDFRVSCPAGSKLAVSVKAAKGTPPLTVRVRSPFGADVASKSGAKVALKNLAATESGRYVVEILSADGAAGGAYSVSVKWKSPTALKQTVTVDPDGRAALVFAAQEGAAVTATLKPGKKSPAAPSLAAVVSPDGRTTPLAGGASGALPVRGTGDYLLVFGAGAPGGAVNLALKFKAPKVPKLNLALGATDVAPRAGVVAAATIGPDGGDLGVDSGPLTGTSISVDAGAVGAPTAFLVGGAPDVAGQRAGAAAGPAVFFGPEGSTFAEGTVTVTIPFDAAVFGADTSKLRVYTRDANGNLAVVSDVTVDGGAHLVSFPVSHFSAYQVVREFAVTESQRLVRTPPPTYVVHGRTLALSGDVLVAGEQNYNAAFEVAAYHRVSGNFVLETDLKPSGPLQLFDLFGYSVAASGDRVLVGAFNRRVGAPLSGAAFVFLRAPAGTWSQEAELDSPTAGEDAFGTSVALEGDTAFVGATQAGPDSRGRVFVFTRDTVTGLWSHQQTLSDPVFRTAGRYGYNVALSGDTAIVREGGTGLPGVCDALYVYRRVAGTWTLGQTLEWPAVPRFVRDVRIDGTTVAVGGADPLRIEFGEVRVLEDETTSFRQVARFTTADVAMPGEGPLDSLGLSVALRGDLLVVGAPDRYLDGAGVLLTGEAHVFQRLGGEWRHALRLRGRPDGAYPNAGRVGSTVVLDGTTAVVGAPDEGNGVNNNGALYVLDLSGN